MAATDGMSTLMPTSGAVVTSGGLVPTNPVTSAVQPASSGVQQLMGTSPSIAAITSQGNAAADALEKANKDKAIADATQAKTTDVYLRSMNNAAGINSDLIQKQATRNQQLDTVVAANSKDVLEATTTLNDPDANILSRVGALFSQSKAVAQQSAIAGTQALENQQTNNTQNILKSVVAASTLKAAETSQDQRDATMNVGVATAQFNGAQQRAKVLSDSIGLQTQILNQAMTGAQLANAHAQLRATNMQIDQAAAMNPILLADAKAKLSMTQEQATQVGENTAALQTITENWNKISGQQLTPAMVRSLPDDKRSAVIQLGSGMTPMGDPQGTLGTLQALGVSQEKAEVILPGINNQANIAQAASQQVLLNNAKNPGIKYTPQEIVAQTQKMISDITLNNDTSVVALGTSDGTGVWAGMNKTTLETLKPLVLANADALSGQTTSSQVQTIAEKLVQGNPNLSANKLAGMLTDVVGGLQKNYTRTLQQQGIPADSFGLTVNQYVPGLFTNGQKPVVLNTPASIQLYAAQTLAKYRTKAITGGQMTQDDISKAYGTTDDKGNTQPLRLW